MNISLVLILICAGLFALSLFIKLAIKIEKSAKTTNSIEKTAATTGLRMERSVINIVIFYCDLIIGFTFIPGLTFVNPSAIILSPSFRPLSTSRFPLLRIPVSISDFLIILFSIIL